MLAASIICSEEIEVVYLLNTFHSMHIITSMNTKTCFEAVFLFAHNTRLSQIAYLILLPFVSRDKYTEHNFLELNRNYMWDEYVLSLSWVCIVWFYMKWRNPHNSKFWLENTKDKLCLELNEGGSSSYFPLNHDMNRFNKHFTLLYSSMEPNNANLHFQKILTFKSCMLICVSLTRWFKFCDKKYLWY